MTIWLAFVALILACMAFGYLVRLLQERSKRERSEFTAEIEGYRERGRHAASQPRTRPPTALVKPKTPRPPMPWYTAPASGITPVIVPGPGKYQPQAGRDSGDGTLTMAKLELPATTGEMAAVTDQYLADMAVQEEQFRLGLAT